MSEYVRVYRQRQDVRFRLRKIKFKSELRDEYDKLKSEEKELSSKMDKIISDEKH